MTSFHAFGVGFDSAFPVPELEEAGAAGIEGPRCELVLASRDDVRRAFSGSREQVRARAAALGEGRIARIEAGRAGDRLLIYESASGEELAVLHLAAGGPRLICAPVDVEDPAFRRYLFDTGLATVALNAGFEALHAGAVLAPAGAVAIAAGEGGGKTTLTMALVRKGLASFTDDILALGVDDGGAARCRPGPPLANLVPTLPDGSTSADYGRVLAHLDGEDWVRVDRPPVPPSAPLAALVLLDRGQHPDIEVERHPRPLVALLVHLLESGTDRERLRARFETAASLATSVPVLEARAPAGAPAAEVADAVLAAVAEVAGA